MATEIKKIEEFWDDFSDDYSKYDSGSNLLYLALINMLRIEKRDHILEVGAGTGFLYHHTLNSKKETAKYVATDISEKMLSIMCKRLKIESNVKEVITSEKYNLTI